MNVQPQLPGQHIAREISYASSARSKGGQTLIRMMENATGRLSLIRRAAGYEAEVAQGRCFWQVMVERYGLSLHVASGALGNIPKTGPLILIANHPFGILDGLMMGHILSVTRGDFRILAHRVFRKAQDLERVILPVAFDETKEATAVNLETRRNALSFLAAGGAIGIFPGGTVSTAPKPFGQALDPVWRNFTARMVAKSNATVLPIHFDGSNSRMFQIASHLHYTLRMALLIREFRRRVEEPVRVAIGDPISPDALAPFRHDPKAMMDFLRARTYALSPKPLKTLGYGFEFEDRYRV
ncbi:lysophospholipid acyltransferase family protein [Oceaniglobus roseus]|uniref:lysophospholipid acyltransferase family protein n=1 Tax=Oceaniglobus roseus TaxID=1737570 RepID=UPI001FE2C526|nr:lysophospholipid acyltransferase family protein [Kandeliimicrobium roseum]